MYMGYICIKLKYDMCSHIVQRSMQIKLAIMNIGMQKGKRAPYMVPGNSEVHVPYAAPAKTPQNPRCRDLYEIS